MSGLTLNTDDVIRVMMATGAGWGDPMERPLELVEQDLKNGYITLGRRTGTMGWTSANNDEEWWSSSSSKLVLMSRASMYPTTLS